jgi:starch synthase
MKILLASSEVHPYSKTGGLADMVGALGRALAQAGHEACIVTPLYRGIRDKFPEMRHVDWYLNLPVGLKPVNAQLWFFEPQPGLTIYFVEQPGYYDRAGIYFEDNISYFDNAERYIFFSKCVAHLARYLPWRADLVHVHDWQTALVPALILQQKQEGWVKPPSTCLTIHNLAYQGVFPREAFSLTNLPAEFFGMDGAEFYGQLNCLKAGIAFADRITTVSPRYAREITTEEFGCGLDGFLRNRQGKLTGILNGVDYQEWTTAKNPFLRASYSATRLTGKSRNKAELQRELGLPVAAKTPLFGTVSRLAEQKGIDIELGALEEMLSAGLQFVLLGSGAPVFERACQDLARRYPKQVAVRIGFSEPLSHRIEGGCDFYLMPSAFEPCGLNQMYSLRYGTIPVVRAVGGLDDSVIDYSVNPERANGIKFREYSATALAKAIRKALAIYQEPELLRLYRRNGMTADFSWERTVQDYLRVYQGVMGVSAVGK